MEERFLVLAATVAAGAVLLALCFGWMDRKAIPGKERVRHGTGHALLGLQEFIEPSVEYIVQAQNVEQKEEEDDEGLGGDEAAIRSELAEALGRTPIDLEEVRRHLSAAARTGVDWKALFEQAASDELRQRPFRAPCIPPVWRVAPRE